jgi:hypothetical protein
MPQLKEYKTLKYVPKKMLKGQKVTQDLAIHHMNE